MNHFSFSFPPSNSCCTSFKQGRFCVSSRKRPLSRKGWLKFRCWSVGGVDSDGSLIGIGNGYFLAGKEKLTAKSFETLDAEITPETIDFFVSDGEGDPYRPSEGFSSIDEAIEALKYEKAM